MKKTINNLTIIIGLIIIFSIIGCESQNQNSMPENLGEMTMSDEEQKIDEPKIDIWTKRKLIKNGEVEFESEDLKETRKNIFKATEKFKGYTSSDNEYQHPYEIRNTLTIRVPSENFDNLLNEITLEVSKFDRKEILVKDVTAVFLDLQARLKTKKELENRYIEILKKANTVTELLEVEKQIGILRSDIESVEGRLKFLKNQVSFSTLNITVYETINKRIEFGNKFKNGFKNGWENLIFFFVYLVNIWTFILIIVGTIIFIRKWKKRKLKEK